MWKHARDARAVAARAREDAQQLRAQAWETRAALRENRLRAMHLLAEWQPDGQVNEPA